MYAFGIPLIVTWIIKYCFSSCTYKKISSYSLWEHLSYYWKHFLYFTLAKFFNYLTLFWNLLLLHFTLENNKIVLFLHIFYICVCLLALIDCYIYFFPFILSFPWSIVLYLQENEFYMCTEDSLCFSITVNINTIYALLMY